jgi:DNA (cytosine-5)-methyltransferase 1
MTKSRGIIVDLFAGGGGASTAIFMATGRHPDVAVNHNPDAIGIHQANHPETIHYTCDVHEVDPVAACTIDGELRPVDVLWASPDCTHFSKARGSKPVEKRIRSLADVVVVWARAVQPRVIALENVSEFQEWGPVLEDGRPCPDKKGLDFRRWLRDLKEAGYSNIEYRELVAADYGSPTTRKRLKLIARRDGEPVRWPAPTHANRATIAAGQPSAAGLKPWRAAAEIIDWSNPAPSIFGRARPLKPKTLSRIAKGIRRYVIDSPEPFIVPVTNATWGGDRVRSAEEPLRTLTTSKGGEFAIAAPTMIPLTHGGDDGRAYAIDEPAKTVTAAPRGETGLVTALLTPRYGEREGQEPRSRSIAAPYPTVVPTGNGGQLVTAHLSRLARGSVGSHAQEPLKTSLTRGKDAVIAASMLQHNGDRVGREATKPLTTLTGRSTQQTVMAAMLDKYYATGVAADVAEPLDTATAKGRFGLVGAFLEQANTGMVGHHALDPVSTIVGKGCTQRLATAAFATHHYGSNTEASGGDLRQPSKTVTAQGQHQSIIETRLHAMGALDDTPRRHVLEFLWRHFGKPNEAEWADPLATAQGRLRFGLVVLKGVIYQIADIGKRMQTPR